MTSVDTSSFVNYLKDAGTPDALLVEKAIRSSSLYLAPVVVSELLSSPKMTSELKEIILTLPQLQIQKGFWERVGDYRSQILRSGKKARLADTMIATFSLDYDIPLISSDGDYRHFVSEFGLQLKTS